MEPTLRYGDRVTVRACHPRRLRPGDVFVFETVSGPLEMHRLVAVLPGGWLVHRGDHQIHRRFGVTRAERVIGRVDLPRRTPGYAERARAAAFALRRALAHMRR
jgi:signal peptidase I